MARSVHQLIQDYPFTPEGAFHSVAEMTAAIGNPRYADDPHYRGQVEAKLARSDRSTWGMSETRPAIQHTYIAPGGEPEDADFSW